MGGEILGLFKDLLTKRKEIVIIDDYDVLYDVYGKKGAAKRIAIESVIGFISRIITQSEFRIRYDGQYTYTDTSYRLNVKTNKNQTAATFWRQVVYQLMYDGECLIVPTIDDYLVVAEDYERIEFAVREDKFRRVRVKNLDSSGEFKRSEVIFLQYGNEELSSFVDSLFGDYGELIARMFELQKMKGQLR